MVTAVAAWSIWGGDVFPAQDPTGSKQARPSNYHRRAEAYHDRSRGLDHRGNEKMAASGMFQFP